MLLRRKPTEVCPYQKKVTCADLSFSKDIKVRLQFNTHKTFLILFNPTIAPPVPDLGRYHKWFKNEAGGRQKRNLIYVPFLTVDLIMS